MAEVVDPSYTTRRARGGTAISPTVVISPALSHERFSKSYTVEVFVLFYNSQACKKNLKNWPISLPF
jgi:hypothetical protein